MEFVTPRATFTLLALHCKFLTQTSFLPLFRWELFSYGKIPYFEMNNSTVSQEVVNGRRPGIPEGKKKRMRIYGVGCPESVYGIMQECWKAEQAERPSFSVIVAKLNGLKNQE